jgi:hypothetical protein
MPAARRAIVTFLLTGENVAGKLPPAVLRGLGTPDGVTYVCLMSFLFGRQEGDTTRTKPTKIVDRGPTRVLIRPRPTDSEARRWGF